jgi:hypothetical protein
MKTVWKFPVPIRDEFETDMPVGAQILVIKETPPAIGINGANDVAQMWALVDPMASREKRRFAVHGTGHDIPNDDRKYLGTFVLPMLAGPLVFHLFELRAP